MKKFMAVLVFFLFLAYSVPGVIKNKKEAKQFPEIKAKSLKGEEIKLPKDIKGRVGIIGVTFKRPKDGLTESWFGPVYERYGQNEDAAVFQIAMIGDVGFAGFFIENGIKGAVDEKRHDSYLIFWGDKSEYEDLVADTEKGNTLYLFVLDREGGVVFKTAEDFATKEKTDKMFEIIDKVIAEKAPVVSEEGPEKQ